MRGSGTGYPTDLGISGEGCFLVRSTNTAECFATRAGLFLKDGDGYLITYDGWRVQGYTDPELTRRGDIQIDEAGAPFAWGLKYFQVNTDGTIDVILADGTQFRRGQIQLFGFEHPERLTATNHGCYAGVSEAVPRPLERTSGIYDPGIKAGKLELINATPEQLATRRSLNLELQGRLHATNVTSELAVAGKGYFLLRNPADGTLSVTRNGSFVVDADGYLMTRGGLRVQGLSDSALTTQGDLRIDGTGRPADADPSAEVLQFYFTPDGILAVVLDDGTPFVRGRVLLQYFREPQWLKPDAAGIITNLAQAVPWPFQGGSGGAGLGFILSGAYEEGPTYPELQLPSKVAPRLKITGEPGMRWVVQATSNLVDWSEVGAVTNTPAEAEFCDEQPMNQPQRFYRVVVSPP